MFKSNVKIENESLKYIPMQECEKLRTYGRCVRDIEHVVLFWTGSGVEINVKASELWVEVESTYNNMEPWISYKVNGALIGRQMLTKGRYFVPLFRNMNSEQEKVVRIYKDVQAMADDQMHGLRILGFLTDGELCDLPEKKLKLEFIGDSITSGEGLRGAKTEWDWIPMFFDSVHDYATLVAEELDADYHIVSQSGWGTLTGWDNNPNSALPDYYDRVCGLASGDRNEKLGSQAAYDFWAWSADAIVINLGTNDNGAFNSPAYKDPISGKLFKQRLNEDGSFNEEDLAKFKEAVVLFLAHLRIKNPLAKLIWAYGMLGKDLEPTIKEAVDEYIENTGDDSVFYQSLPGVTPETVGSREHPGVLAHRATADVLLKKIKEVLSIQE